MASYSVEYTGVQGNVLEGPHWMDEQQTLLFNDILDKKVHIWDPKNKQLDTVQFQDTVGFVVPHTESGYVVGCGRTLLQFHWDSPGDATVISEVDQTRNTRFNDGKCDAQGRLWAGTCDRNQGLDVPLNAGSLYKFDHHGDVHLIETDYNISNGLSWSHDQRYLYHAESLFPSCVYVYDFDPSNGQVDNRRVLVDFSSVPQCRPDGMTIDVDGHLWLVLHGQGKVAQIDTTTGQTVREVLLPLKNVTSCCFGGQYLDDLYVTSMKWDENDPSEAGSLMRVTGLGTRGLPPVSYHCSRRV